LSEHPDTYDLVWFWVVVHQGAPVAAALRTEPYNLVLADPSSRSALDALLEAIIEDDAAVPGVVGNLPHIGTAASILSTATRRESEMALAQGVYELTAVREVPRVAGMARAATPDDRELLIAWLTTSRTRRSPSPITTSSGSNRPSTRASLPKAPAFGFGRTRAGPSRCRVTAARRRPASASVPSTPRRHIVGAVTRRAWSPNRADGFSSGDTAPASSSPICPTQRPTASTRRSVTGGSASPWSIGSGTPDARDTGNPGHATRPVSAHLPSSP
jgi:hypothetical protein